MDVFISPPILFSFKWRHSLNLDLALFPLKLTSYCTSSSHLLRTTSLLCLFFSLLLSNKGFILIAQRLFFVFCFIPILHLRIKPTKYDHRSIQDSPRFFLLYGCSFFLCSNCLALLFLFSFILLFNLFHSPFTPLQPPASFQYEHALPFIKAGAGWRSHRQN